MSVTVRVEPEDRETYTKQPTADAIVAWLESYEDALVAAATNPDMAPGSVGDRERLPPGGTVRPNNVYLREFLGGDWSPVDEAKGPGLFVGPGVVLALPADRVREPCSTGPRVRRE